MIIKCLFHCFFVLYGGLFFSSFGVFGKRTHSSPYGALKARKINLRQGPGSSYAVLCHLVLEPGQRWPVVIIRQKDHWYLVRDYQGTTGWVNGAMMNFSPWFLTIKKDVPLYKNSSGKKVMAILGCFSTLSILKEKNQRYYVSVGGYGLKGWVSKDVLWPHGESLNLQRNPQKSS